MHAKPLLPCEGLPFGDAFLFGFFALTIDLPKISLYNKVKSMS